MEYIQIGKILNTHGVKGELKVEVYTDFKEERFKKNTKIYLGDEYIEVIVKSFRMHHDFMLLTLKDLEDINLVLKYKNMIIYKSEKDIKPLDDGFYFRDLQGLEVFVDGIKKGVVLKAETGMSSDYLRVKNNEGKEVLIPILDNFIKSVDLKNQRINIVNMDGLL